MPLSFPCINSFTEATKNKKDLLCARPAMYNTFQTETLTFSWCQICFSVYTELQDDNPGFSHGIETLEFGGGMAAMQVGYMQQKRH